MSTSTTTSSTTTTTTTTTAAAVQPASDEERQELAKAVDLPIIYLDQHIIVIDKPFGLNTIPGNKLVNNGGGKIDDDDDDDDDRSSDQCHWTMMVFHHLSS